MLGPAPKQPQSSSLKFFCLLVILCGLIMSAYAEKKNTPGTGDRAQGRVLLITDENHASYIDTLASRGIEVVGVCTGTAAFVSLQKARPHVVVADPQTRGLKIRELARMLAQSEDGIPLVLAGHETATIENRRAALVSGAFDYFELPLEFDLLVERTDQLVALRGKI